MPRVAASTCWTNSAPKYCSTCHSIANVNAPGRAWPNAWSRVVAIRKTTQSMPVTITMVPRMTSQ